MRPLFYFCTFMICQLQFAFTQPSFAFICLFSRRAYFRSSTRVLEQGSLLLAVISFSSVCAQRSFRVVPQRLLSACCSQEQFSFTFVLYFILACSCSYSVPAESLYSATLFPWWQVRRSCYLVPSGLREGGQWYPWLLRPFQWGEFFLLGQSLVLVVFLFLVLVSSTYLCSLFTVVAVSFSVPAFFLLCECVVVRFLLCLLMLVLHWSSLPIRCLRLTSVSLQFLSGDHSGMDTL